MINILDKKFGIIILTLAILLSSSVFVAEVYYRIKLTNNQIANIGGVEQNNVLAIQKLLDNQDLYSNPEFSPYSITQYPPIHFIAAKVVCKILGISATDYWPIFKVNRYLCLMYNFLFVIILFSFLSFIIKINVFQALVISLSIFSTFTLSVFAKPDSLFLLFWLISFALFYYLLKRDKLKDLNSLFLLALLCGFSIFTKQTGVFFSVFIIGYLLFYMKNIKSAIWFCIFSTGIVLIGYFILFNENHLDIYLNLVQGVNNGMFISGYVTHIVKEYLNVFQIPIFLACIISLYYLLNKNEKVNKVFLFAFLFFLLTALFSTLKRGSNQHYFIQANVMGYILILLTISNLSILYKNVRLKPIIWGGFLLFIIMVPARSTFEKLWDGKGLVVSNNYNEDLQVAQYLNNIGIQPEDKIFMSYMGQSFLKNIFYNNVIAPQQDVVFCCAYPLNRYDYTQLEDDIKSCNVRYIITHAPIESIVKFFIPIDYSQYKLTKKLKGYYIYEC